ncbi:MAG: hypothetical protein ACREBJ_08565, partial [Nitrosotalea sp.]
KNSGTIITLILNEEGQKIDLAKSITHYVKSAAVPIFIGKESTEPLKFDWNSEDSTITIEFKKYYKTERSISIDFVRDYEDDDIWIRWYESMPFGRKVFISNQGFYVGKFEEKIICPHNSILLVNVKKNILDLNVSRDRIRVGTPKFDDFEKKWIKIMYKILKKELEDELKKTNGNIVDEYLLKFQLVRDYGLMEPIYYYHSESIIHYTELPLHIQEFFQTQISHLVITSDGFKLVSFNELVSMSPQSVKVFQLPMSDDVDNRAEIFAVESHIKKQLKPNEILIFLFEPPWDYEWDKFTEYFKLKLGKDISFSELTLPELCGNLSVAETTLDVLLPKNSNFASLSEMFRSSVICSSKYSIQLLITSRMEEIPYFILGFSVSEKFQKQVTDGKFAVKKEGKIVFDLEDQFIKLLFKNEKTILNSPILVDMLKSYFGLLALVYFSNVYFTYDLLEQKERELLQSLNISEKIPPLIKRQGQISKGLKSVRLLHALGSRNSLITVTGESSLQF